MVSLRVATEEKSMLKIIEWTDLTDLTDWLSDLHKVCLKSADP